MSDTHTAPTGLPLQLHVRDGMSRQRRYLPALEQNYFNVDEMTFAQLLTQLQDYARLVKVPGVTFSPEDIEQILFARDEIVVMAQILALNIDDLEQRFNARLQQEIGTEEWALTEAQNPASVLGLARTLDRWLCLIKHPQSSAGENLYGLIESVILGLAKELYRVHGVMPERVKQSQYFSSHFMHLITAGEQPSETRERDNANKHIELNIRSLYVSLLKAVDMIQASARQLLPESMHSKNHDPALALRIAFITLYQKLQHRLNRFTLDFIDFYFTQILQAKTRPIQPDSVYLVFQPGAKERDIRLPKGTEFFAGIDSASRDIVYASDDEVIINDAQVEQLYSLFFPRVKLDLRAPATARNSVEKNQKSPSRASVSLADGCWLNVINAQPKGDKKTRDKFTAQPFFGAARNLTNSDGRASDAAMSARLGFAVASNVLLLREGQRHITVELAFEDITRQPWSKLNNILRYLPNIKDNIADDKAKFFAYFSKLFQLSLTTAEGWLDIAEYKPAYSAIDASIKPNAVRLSFLLPENTPAISGYQTQVHGDPLTTALPVLRFTLKENYLQYPYDILKQLVLKEVRIQVDVKGCHDLLLHNNIGQLSPLAPFTPFGPMPDVGSYFIVGHEETRSKQLSSLSVDVEWSSLPINAGGFSSWYRNYLHPKDNHLFVASVSVLADGRWQPAGVDNNQTLFNFPLKNGTAHLVTSKTLSANSAIPFYKAQDQYQAKRPFTYSPLTRSGLFKFTLQGPLGAFGHREYPNLLAEVLTHNTRVKHPRFARPIPNPPYTPEISAIRLNYSAVSILTLSDTGREDDPCYKDQFFHLHPLGWEAISPLRHPRLYLLPQYPDDGSLFIGIAASPIQQLSLFFHLQNNSLPLSDELLAQARREGRSGSLTPAALVSWSYLSDNQWKSLNPRHILSDSTEGFMTSGIITLTMPDKITAANSIMPGGLYWLKISANQALTHFSDLFSVYAQAVKVTWRSGTHPPAEQPMQLPPDTIKRPRQTIAGITGISQITGSFGGVPAENLAHLRTQRAFASQKSGTNSARLRNVNFGKISTNI